MTPDDYTVLWSGKGAMPHQERDAQYWQQRESMLERAAPSKGGYLSRRDLGYTPPQDRPQPTSQRCRSCGKKYKTRIPTQRRLCPNCRGQMGRPKKIAA